MSEREESASGVQYELRRVTELLRMHEMVESLVHRQQGPRQELVEGLVQLFELGKELESLHPADVARFLEALPLAQRLIAWDLLKPEREGEILLEVSDAVRETLIAHMHQRQLSKPPTRRCGKGIRGASRPRALRLIQVASKSEVLTPGWMPMLSQLIAGEVGGAGRRNRAFCGAP